MTNFEIGPQTPIEALRRMEQEQKDSLETVKHSDEGRARVLAQLSYIAFEITMRMADEDTKPAVA